MTKAEREAAAREDERRKAEAEEEARRQAEEDEREAEERARAAEEAAAAQRDRAENIFERRRAVREDERGAPVLNQGNAPDPEREALRSLADERPNDVPSYTMTIPEDEIRTSVTIPEDEIRFTPGLAPQQQPEPVEDPYQRVLAASGRFQQGAAPDGRAVNFDALDAQDDAAATASQQAAAANVAAQQQMPPPGTPQATAPAQPPAGTPSPPPSPPTAAPPTSPPAPASLPEQQREADVRQATAPQGSRIPQDVRTAAMPEPEPALRMPAAAPAMTSATASAPPSIAESDEDAARRALRQERAMKAMGYILRLAGGLGGAALYNRGGSEIAAQMLARGLGGVGGALSSASPTTQQARIAQARAGDERRTQQGQEVDLRRLAQQAAERRQSMLDEQGAQRLDLEGRRVAAMEEGVGLRAQQTEAQAAAARALAEERGARGELARTRAEEAAAARDPESPTSRQAQAELRALMARVPEDERISDDEIGALSASAADTLYNQVARRYGLRTRETRRGGDGGGGGTDRLGPTRSFRDFAAREYPELADLSPEERDAAIAQAWSQLSGAERRAYVGGSAMADTREDAERIARANNIPGWRWRNSSVPPDVVTIRDAQDAAEGSAAARDNLQQMLDISSRVTTGERLAGIVGESQAVAEYQAARNAFIGSLPTLRNTGVINEGEYQRFSREFPDVVSVRTIGNIQNNVRAAQTTIQRGYRIKMQSLGFEPEDPQARDVTRFRGPDGAVYRLSDPRAIERARAAGWEAM